MYKFSTKHLFLGVAMAGALHSVGQTTFNGAVSFPTNNAGVYQFSTDAYNPVLLKNNIFASGGGFAYDGYYYGIRFEVIMGIPALSRESYKISDWSESDKYTGVISDVATDYAYSPNLNRVFGCFYNAEGDGFVFSTVKPAYFAHTAVKTLEKALVAMDFDKNNVLYAIDEDGILNTVDYNTGDVTPVGDTGVKTEWITGGIIDPATGNMIYSVKNSTEAALYSVDLTTAKATKLYDLANEEQLGGFFIPEAPYSEDVPAVIYFSPSVNVSGMNLNGNIRFQMPSSTNGGVNGNKAPLKYHVWCNGEKMAEGESAYSAGYVTVDFAVETPGYYSFAIATENEAGMSPVKRTDPKWIGPDTPRAPGSITVSGYEDGEVSLRWGSVSSGLHDGNIDRTNLVYRVTRYPEGKVVSASDLKTVSMKDPIPVTEQRITYYYTVEAVCGDMVSPAAKSATFALGAIVPPYNPVFPESSSDKSGVFGYSYIKNDSKSWDFYKNEAYVSTSAKPANNYMVLPPLKLEGGSSYQFSIKARAYSASYTETFDVVLGKEATAEALNVKVVDNAVVVGKDYTTVTGEIVPEESGIYYLAIHTTTATGGGTLYLTDLNIASGHSNSAPAAPSDVKAESDANGLHKATVTFITSAKTLAGEDLAELTKVELLRDGEVIKTVTEGIAPATEMTIVDDTEPAAGDHIYGVICYNSFGASPAAETKCYIGLAAPEDVQNITMVEVDNSGYVKASWNPVTKDIAGHDLKPEDVTYTVWTYRSSTQELFFENIKETSCELQALPEDEKQQFVQVLVQANTEGGKSTIKPSVLTPLGKPYTAPWYESFANKELNSILGQRIIKGSDKMEMSSETKWGVKPYDNDGGMLYFDGYGGASTAVYTGKIDLGDLYSPAFQFYVFNYTGGSGDCRNEIKVEVSPAGEEFVTLLETLVCDGAESNSWRKVSADLSEYAGQVVQMQVTVTNTHFGFTHLDKFQVVSSTDYNVALTSIAAPASVDRNKDFTVGVKAENLGNETARNFNVVLTVDDEIVADQTVPNLASEGSKVVEFTLNYPVTAPDEIKVGAFLDWGLDQFAGDNEAEPVTVVLRHNALPAVSDLKAENSDGQVNLTWSAPAELKIGTSVTENLDEPSYAWRSSVPGWTFRDYDKGTIGGVGSRQLPVNGVQSFFVMDCTHSSLLRGGEVQDQFRGHSGNQYLCSMYSNIGDRGVQNDDWAISPELSGEPQTITLWASSFLSDAGDNQYYESFEILYSTTGTDVEDFQLVDRFIDIPARWIEYSAYLPAGTKYFAIRGISAFQYMLFIDDITYIAKNGDKTTVFPNGYHVYRDGDRLTDEFVTLPNFADATAPDGKTVTYHVSTVYNEGESRLSNPAEIMVDLSGVGVIETGAAIISAGEGTVTVTGAEGQTVNVYAADGRVVASKEAAASTTIYLQKGIYLVRLQQSNQVAKVVVR